MIDPTSVIEQPERETFSANDPCERSECGHNCHYDDSVYGKGQPFVRTIHGDGWDADDQPCNCEHHTYSIYSDRWDTLAECSDD